MLTGTLHGLATSAAALPAAPGTVVWRGASLAARRDDGTAQTAAAVKELLHAADVEMLEMPHLTFEGVTAQGVQKALQDAPRGWEQDRTVRPNELAEPAIIMPEDGITPLLWGQMGGRARRVLVRQSTSSYIPWYVSVC